MVEIGTAWTTKALASYYNIIRRHNPEHDLKRWGGQDMKHSWER